MPKTLENYFVDWENYAYGYGYGTGEPHVLPVLEHFLRLYPDARGHNHVVMEKDLGPIVTWLMINRMCRVGILDYGTSPRHTWLTTEGKALKKFVTSTGVDKLIELATACGLDYIHCNPAYCNCGPGAYSAAALCPNPFWRNAARRG